VNSLPNDDELTQLRPQEGPQTDFLECPADIAVYGGAAGGGKSFALLLEAMYDVVNPQFGAVIFRRTRKQITDEGGLWDTASELFLAQGASLNQSDLIVQFKNGDGSLGGRVGFAGMEHEKDRFQWQGSQIPYIGFDELTHFTWKQFNYMFSRNRSSSGAKSRIRGTCNPDPDSWVKKFIQWWLDPITGYAIPERSGIIRYFIVTGDDVSSIVWGATRKEILEQYPNSAPKSFTFIASKLSDNKILMEKDPAYRANLLNMTRVEREQLLEGNWNIRASAGKIFPKSAVEIIDVLPAGVKMVKTCRAWDQASTKEKMEKKKMSDPDWTAGVKMSRDAAGVIYVQHVEKFRLEGEAVDTRIKNTAKADGKMVRIRLAQDPGSAGKRLAASQIQMLLGWIVTALPVTGDKETRALPFAAQWQGGNVKLLRGSWNDAFLDELERFPEGGHDDQVDAAADAFDEIALKGYDLTKMVSN